MTIPPLKAPPPPPVNPYLRLAIEAGPLSAFVLSYIVWGLKTATAVFMVAITISLIASIKLEKRVPLMPLITAVVVLIFGGLTLYLDSDIFIKMKPTIVNSLFALILFAGLAFGKSFLKPLLGFAFQLHDRGWKLLSLRWAIFFVFLAIVNEFVWRTQSTDFWVGFKVFGNLPMTLIFVGFQMPLLKRYTIAPDQPGGSQ